MTIHKSLKVTGRLRRTRNVLSRWERIEKLRDQNRWNEKDGVLGLPKTIAVVKVKKKKKKEK